MSKKLQRQIEKKLNKLSQLLDKIDEARILNSDEPENWNSDTLYSLAEELKETLQLLEDKTGKQLDEFGDPIVLEPGLCSLMDDWESQEEEDYD
ncbi:hypothetical protein [endosymbiont GvMRE of Glomus versiforme]|uniref:hypothetical protein n=1 Tax=endosymbiont GvMRE of Glomus versiforme TaxID=2039283 RepID=UPI000EDC2A51|nr:hypothetical protein [endosymbiont GvMRE of Glomus versiforme]RHZ36687.1 hypothetical protein GvMRE_I2g570 [endosymbiont GvMRE of Glomus versiforme]RHZ37546.1 hypothetical protein GvMRE_I1g712 [endosymbiont GvMRE of Glomus versiforme]